MNLLLVYCLARTGSTTLVRMVNCLPGTRCLNEPFNPNNLGGRHLRRVVEEASVAPALSSLSTEWNGIKQVWDPSGWPFPAGSKYNEELLRQCGGPIVILSRRNALKRVVSSQISEQTKVWSFQSIEHRRRFNEH